VIPTLSRDSSPTKWEELSHKMGNNQKKREIIPSNSGYCSMKRRKLILQFFFLISFIWLKEYFIIEIFHDN